MDSQLQNVLKSVRDLTPETIRARLLEMEAEEKALRVLLRASLKGRLPKPEDQQGAAR